MGHGKNTSSASPQKDDGKSIQQPLEDSVREIIDSLPPEKRSVLLAELVSFGQSSSLAGPIPHPELYAGYEKTLPGSANRILTMAEKQLDNDFVLHKMESEITPKSSKALIQRKNEGNT